MRQLITEIEINSSADRDWDILTDFPRFPEWNPFIKRVEGGPVEGERLRVLMIQPDGKEMSFNPKIIAVDSNKTLRWLGHLGVPGIFDGEHIFEIFTISDELIRFVHREIFKGILVPFLWKTLDTKIRQLFLEMNNALKQRAEGKD